MSFRTTGRQAAWALGAALVLGLASTAPVAGQQRESAFGPRTLEGTWRIDVTTRNCTTGAPLASFRAYLTFARGGTMTGTTSSPAFKPGQRTGDFGVWRRTAGHTYVSASEAFILFDSPASPPVPALTRGWQRLTQEITIDRDDAGVFDSVARNEFYDMAGTLLAQGCATAVGHRFE